MKLLSTFLFLISIPVWSGDLPDPRCFSNNKKLKSGDYKEICYIPPEGQKIDSCLEVLGFELLLKVPQLKKKPAWANALTWMDRIEFCRECELPQIIYDTYPPVPPIGYKMTVLLPYKNYCTQEGRKNFNEILLTLNKNKNEFDKASNNNAVEVAKILSAPYQTFLPFVKPGKCPELKFDRLFIGIGSGGGSTIDAYVPSKPGELPKKTGDELSKLSLNKSEALKKLMEEAKIKCKNIFDPATGGLLMKPKFDHNKDSLCEKIYKNMANLQKELFDLNADLLKIFYEKNIKSLKKQLYDQCDDSELLKVRNLTPELCKVDIYNQINENYTNLGDKENSDLYYKRAKRTLTAWIDNEKPFQTPYLLNQTGKNALNAQEFKAAIRFADRALKENYSQPFYQNDFLLSYDIKIEANIKMQDFESAIKALEEKRSFASKNDLKGSVYSSNFFLYSLQELSENGYKDQVLNYLNKIPVHADDPLEKEALQMLKKAIQSDIPVGMGMSPLRSY